MSLELLNTLGTLATFVVIAATAIAAIVQLRHARSSNHIAALNELRETRETPHFQAANNFVAGQLSEKLHDPAFRYQLAVAGASRRSWTLGELRIYHGSGARLEGCASQRHLSRRRPPHRTERRMARSRQAVRCIVNDTVVITVGLQRHAFYFAGGVSAG